jgi:hypothetical protein
VALIDFGVQSSGNDSSKAINKVWNELLEIFYDDPAMSGYFDKLDDFQIVFRVSGEGTDFEGEGPECLKVICRGKTISIDFTIPEDRWMNVPEHHFREYISKGVQACFKLLREKAVAMNEVKNLKKLDADFEKGMKTFKKE